MTKILDCTIRDGGHINGWNFSSECVQASYNAALSSGVDIFEIGYRYENPLDEWGCFAKCDDEFLDRVLSLNTKCRISVMIDAGKSNPDEFKYCDLSNTIISLVRVATYSNNLEEAFYLCENLSDKGYAIYLNLMAISEYSKEDLKKIEKWAGKDNLESICFADSFGTFVPSDVRKYYELIKRTGMNNVSFHAHNNLQLAFANTLEAIQLGAYSVDASIYGMGRDAGNLPVEIIIGYLNKIGFKTYNPIPYLEVIENYYEKFSKISPWGYNVKSLLSGLKNIHPCYVNGLYNNKNLNSSQIWEIADMIKKDAPIFFSEKDLNRILKNDQ